MRLLADENFPGEAVAAFASRDDWVAHFSVVEENRVRMAPLPQRSGP